MEKREGVHIATKRSVKTKQARRMGKRGDKSACVSTGSANTQYIKAISTLLLVAIPRLRAGATESALSGLPCTEAGRYAVRRNAGKKSPHGCRAIHAIIFPHIHRVPVIAQADDLFALRATRRFEFWRVLEFFEIVFIRTIIHVHFGLKVFAAFFAGFPIANMPFIEMVTAQCITVMVSAAAIASEGKQNIVMLVIANPIATTFGFG